MKTKNEYYFERLVVNLIIRKNISIDEKVALFLNFHQNSRDYYEKLCDFLYMISVGRTDHSLWISPSGEPKLAYSEEGSDELLICKADDVPSFRGDIISQLLYAFRRIEVLTASVEKVPSGSTT